MAKRPILGNDPFLRGAAPRLPPASAATLAAASGASEEKPREQPEAGPGGGSAAIPAASAPAVAPALDGKPPRAARAQGRSRTGGAEGARLEKAPESSPAASDPGKVAKPTTGRAAKRADGLVPRPAKAPGKEVGKSKRAGSAGTGASKGTPVAGVEGASEVARQAERPVVLEGEVVESDSGASASLPPATPGDATRAVRAATASASAAAGTPSSDRPSKASAPPPSADASEPAARKSGRPAPAAHPASPPAAKPERRPSAHREPARLAPPAAQRKGGESAATVRPAHGVAPVRSGRHGESLAAHPAPSRVTPEALIATVEGAVNRIFDSPMAGRAMEAIEAAPGIEKVLGAAGKAIDAARPAYELASRLLPPALAAARSVVAAIVSGSASRAVASGAVELAEALVRAARDPGLPPEVDAFGEDPGLSARAEPLLDFLHDRYFRVEATGIEHVPMGPSLLVCNHSGALPLDGPMIRTVLRRECRRPDARWLVEDAIFHAPFVGVLLNRLGAVRACPENAERLLAAGTPLAVFPEGVLGIGKLIGRRYQLQRFGRGGFVKIAMRSGVPIVPVAIVGAEEATPLLAKIPVGLESVPYLPVTPTFPLLGPLGLVPLPTKWKVSFLPPVDVSSHGARGAEDHALVARIAGEIRDALQSELDRQVDQRGSILGG